MPDIDLTEMHALAEQAASAAYDRWCHEPAGDADTHDLARRAAGAAVDTVAPLLIEQGRRQVLHELVARMADPRAALSPLRTVQEFIDLATKEDTDA